MHEILVRKRLSFDREFFTCSLDEAKAAMATAKRVDEGRMQEAQKFAGWLRARASVAEIDQMSRWLEVCDAKDVAVAIRRGAWLEGCKPKDVTTALRREAA